MNQLSKSAAKTFYLLSLGQRRVGKTVFIAGSYTELHAAHQTNDDQQLWFDCQDSDGQENLEKILSLVARTGQYPPPTTKITSFNFSLKRQSFKKTQTLCHFRWWDIPGEYCNIRHPDFHEIVLSSHGCCVFIDANELMHNPAYLQALDDIFQQVVAIASAVYHYRLSYPFALIFTKCDLLEPGEIARVQTSQNLQPLLTHLDEIKTKYKRFYSSIPIVRCLDTSTLKSEGAAAALLWLLDELSQLDYYQSAPALSSRLMHNESTLAGSAKAVDSLGHDSLRAGLSYKILLLTLVSISLLSVISSLFFAFNLFFRTSFHNCPNLLSRQSPAKIICK